MRIQLTLYTEVSPDLYSQLKRVEGHSGIITRLPGPLTIKRVREAPEKAWETPGHMLFRTMSGHRGRCECGGWKFRGMFASDVVEAHEKHVAEAMDQ